MEALCKYISGVALSLAALFAPIVPLIWCVVGFICFDFVTGIMASRAEAREQGQEWYFESHLAWRTAEKLGFTIIALCMAFCIDELMLDFLSLNLTKLFAGFVCGVEMWSFLENACRVSDAPLLRYIKRYVRHKVENQVQK